ncbi:hypothetical protein [uncultured Kordia sp.]|uniref:hypothetical protein n=1 Tax=uncultured Kordia sp. TaxID=507699 RepID=UPI002606051A|nr:hypothetical protein [uncultured Kordia sp.]
MTPKTKALILNLIAFVSLFVVLRYLVLGYIISTDGLWLAFIAAVITSILAPKFFVVKDQGKEKLIMKTIFSKDIREL